MKFISRISAHEGQSRELCLSDHLERPWELTWDTTVYVHVYYVYVYVHVGDRVSLTEISLAPQEFDDYQIGVDVSITFCLKELRVSMCMCRLLVVDTGCMLHTCTCILLNLQALLVFTDAINQSLSIRFEGPGR